MQAIRRDGLVHDAIKKAIKPLAWASAFALTASFLVGSLNIATPEAQAQVPPSPLNTPAGSDWRLTSNWNPPGVLARDALFVTGDNASIGARDDEGGVLTNEAFIGYWRSDTDGGPITNQNPRLAAGYSNLTGNAANHGGRMSAIDSGDYSGTPDYQGNGPTLYVWSNDSFDFFKTAAGHPAEFTDAMIGTMPTDHSQVCRPTNWDNSDRGSWVSVVSYPENSRDGTVFWVPNPRAADVMSAYDSDSGGPNKYPGYYQTPRNPNWDCGKPLNWDDGWGGGEVIQSTGEIFFTSRQSSKMSSTYRAMIFNPKTGVFAASGPLQPNAPGDDIFGSSDSKVVGDLMVDGNGNGYILVEGRAPIGSIWHDPYDPEATGGQRVYLVRVVPTKNPNYDPTDPNSSRYLHNAGWKYNIVQRIYSNPAEPTASNVYYVFGELGFDTKVAAQTLKGSDWYNGYLYTNNNRWLFQIDPVSGRVDTVPFGKNTLVAGFTGSNKLEDEVTPRDMASGQEAMAVSGSVFNDHNGNGLRDPGDEGMPGVQMALYEDSNNDGIWNQLTDAGLHITDSSGNYTFFVSNLSRYQIRVVTPTIDGKPAYQTSASYGWGNLKNMGRNEVDAHCYDAPDGVRGNNEGDEITAFGGSNAPQPCLGAIKPPFTDTPLPPVAANMTDPSYTLDNRDGAKVPFYSTLIIGSATRIPNADFGFHNEPPDTRCYPAKSEMTIDPAGPLQAGQSYNVTVTAKDKNGAVCQTATNVSFSADPSGPSFSQASCTTDAATGQCKVTVKSDKVGTYNIHALMPDPANNNTPTDLGGGGDPTKASPQARAWVPGPICESGPNASTLVVDPSTITPGQTTVATIHLQDCLGNPISDKTQAQMHLGPPENAFSGFQNKGGGVYTVTVDPPDALGDQPVTADVEDIDGTPAHLEDTVTTVPTSNCSAAKTSFTVNPAGPLQVGGGRTYTLDVTALDAAGNVCVGGTVAFDVTTDQAGSDAVTQPALSATSCVTDAQGHCTTPVTSTSTKAGQFWYHAMVNGVEVGGNGDTTKASPQQRTWTFESASCGAGANSGWTITPGQLPAGEKAKGELALYDQYGNPCTGVADKITVGPSDPAGLTNTPVKEDPNNPGHYLTDLTANPSNTTTYHEPASYDPDGPGGAAPKTFTADVTFLKPQCDPGKSEWTLTPAGPIEAGQSYTATVSAKTATGDVCEVPTKVTFSSPQAGPVFTPVTCTTDAATGQCSTQVTSTKAGTFPLHATLPDPAHNNAPTDLGGGGDPAKASPQNRTWTFETKTCGQGAGSGWSISPSELPAGDTAQGELALYDQYGNPCTGQADKITVGPSNPAGLMNTPVTESPVVPGHYYTDLTANPPQTTTYHEPASYDPDGPGGLAPKNFTDDVTFVKAQCDPASSEWSITPEGPLTAGDSYTAKVTAKDVNGNICGVPTPVTFSSPQAGPVFTPATCTTDAATGQCSVTVKSDKAGTFPLHATMPDPAKNNTPTDLGGGGDPTKASPQDRTWVPGPICESGPNASTLVVNPSVITPGLTTLATIHLQDCLGNPIPDKTQAQMHLGPPENAFSNFQNKGDGVYTVTVDPPDALGEQPVTADVEDIDGTPAHLEDTVTTVPTSNCDAAKTGFTVTPAGPLEVGGGRTYTLDVTALDAAGNVCVGGTVSFDVTTDQAGAQAVLQPALSASTCVTNDQGHCTTPVTSTSTKAGQFWYHAKVNSVEVGGNGDKTKASPQQRTWTFESASCGVGANSGWTITPSELAAGEKAKGELALYDRFGNPCTGVADKITVGPSDPAGLTNTPVKEDPNNPGHYLTDLTANPTDTTTYHEPASYDPDGPGGASSKDFTSDVTFTVPILFDPKNSWYHAVATDGHLPVYVAETYTVTAHIRDTHDRPMAGQTVTFASAPALAFTPTTCQTDAQGACTVTVTTGAGHKSGVYNVTASVGGTAIDPTTDRTRNGYNGTTGWQKDETDARGFFYDAPDAPAVKFWGGPDLAHAVLTVNPDHQTAGSPVKVHIAALDQYDNPVEDLMASDLSVDGSPVNPTTNPAITTTPGTFDSSNAAKGDYYFDLTSKLAGEFKLTGTGRGQEIADRAGVDNHPHVWFVPGEVCTQNCEPVDPANKTRIEITKNAALADGKDPDQAKAYAYDHYGNAVAGADVVSTRSPDAGNQPLTPAVQTVKTGPDGTAQLAWTSLKAGSNYTVGNTIGGQTVFPGSVLNNLTFMAVALCPNCSLLEITPSPTAGAIPAGSPYTAKVTAIDLNGQPVAGAPVTWEVTPKAGTTPRYPVELSATSCATGADGTCSVTIIGKSAGDYEVHAKLPDPANNGTPTDVGGAGNPAKASPQTISYAPGPVCVVTPNTTCDPDQAFQTRVTVTQDYQKSNGIDQDQATVFAFDAYGNPVPNAAWTSAKVNATDPLTVVAATGTTGPDGQAVISYTAINDGGFPASVTVGGLTPPESPVTLHFTNAPGTCTMSKSPDSGVAAGGKYTITTTCVNEAGQPDQGVSPAFKTSSPDLTFVGPATCTTNAQGTCSVEVTATKVGDYQVGYVTPPAPNVVGDPQTVSFGPGPVDAAQSETHVIKNGATADGSDQDRVQVIAKDKYGNVVPGQAVTSSSSKAGITIQSAIPPTDAAGQTVVSYTSKVATTYPVDLKIGQVTPKGGDGSPVTLGFNPAGVAKVTLTVAPAVAGTPTPLVVGRDPVNTYALEGKAFDAQNNPVPGVTMQFATDPQDGPTYVDNTRTCVTGADGTCTVQVYSTKAGSYAATVSSGVLVSEAQTIIWRPGPVCGVECVPDPATPQELWTRVEVITNGQIADGQHADEVKVYAYDKFGNAVPNQIIATTPDDQRLVPMPVLPVTGDGLNGTTPGVAVVSYYSTTAWVDFHPDIRVGELTGNPADMKVPRGLPVTLNFIAGPVCQTAPAASVPSDQRTRVEVTRNGATADGKATDEVAVYAFDCNGNAARGVQPASTPDSPIAVHGPITPIDDNGRSVIDFVSSQPVDNGSVPVTLPDGSGQQQPVKYFPVGSDQPKAFDPAHPEQPASSPVGLTFAPQAKPAPPAITTVDGDDVTDNVPDATNDPTPEIAGTGQPGDQVKVTEDGQTLCTAVVQPNGTWACSPEQPLPDGPHTVTATQTDPGTGQTSAPSGPATFTVDTTPPATPVITTPAEGSTITDTTPTVTGTVPDTPENPLDPGTVVVVADPRDPSNTCTAEVRPDGTWSCTLPKPLPEGPNSVTAEAKDPAGNTSPKAENHFTVDTTGPTITITSPTPDTVTNQDPIPVSGTGDTAGDPVKVDDGHGHSCETTVRPDLTWSCDLAGTPEGPIVITATETDQAGRTGTDTVPVTVDRTKPCIVNDPRPLCHTTPDQPYFDITTVGGADVTDNVPDFIADNRPVIAGVGEQPGDAVKVTEGGQTLCATVVQANLTWSCTPDTPLVDGPHTIVGTETDAAGNESDPVTRQFTIDTLAPPTPVIVTPGEGSLINDNTPTVAGTITGTPEHPLDPGTVVIVQDKDDPSNTCTASVADDGTWSCDLPKPLADGQHTVTAQAKDPAGNLSPTTEVHFGVDTTPPFIIPDLRDPGHIGVDTEPNADVTITNEGGKTICTAKADASGHAVCVPEPGDVPQPGDKITITAVDEAGNQASLDVRIVMVKVSDPDVVLPDENTEVITGLYFHAGEKVHAVLDGSGIDLGWATAGPHGTVTFTWIVPDDPAAMGHHTVTLTGETSGSGSAEFDVTHTAPLPVSGAHASATLVGAGGLAFLLGLGLVLVAGRRRHELGVTV